VDSILLVSHPATGLEHSTIVRIDIHVGAYFMQHFLVLYLLCHLVHILFNIAYYNNVKYS